MWLRCAATFQAPGTPRWTRAPRYGERRRHDFGTPDWAELQRVIKGDGPCNAERVENRRKAYEDGAWVREAAAAHAGKEDAA